MSLRQRKFTFEDQIAFAELSGDNNPLHVDRIAARRYIFGEPVVHGIHLVLWALDRWLEDRTVPVNLLSIKARFLRPILLEEVVRYTAASERSHVAKIELSSSGAIATRIEFEWDGLGPQRFDSLEPHFPKQRSPRVLTEEEIGTASGVLTLCLNTQSASKLFPHLLRCLPPTQIAVILSTSRLVGVECPGLHSFYSELDFCANSSHQDATLNYEVAKFDKRFGLAIMKVLAPGMTGSIKAVVRPVPQEQAGYRKLKELVNSHEFSGQQALIVGGSRGLGEVAAKLLCAGGAKVRLTYHRGKEDACRVVDEVSSNGGIANVFPFDVLNLKEGLLETFFNGWRPTHLYYFATPFIAPGVEGRFSLNLFQRFCDYYVTGFMNTVNQLKSLGLKNVFYPSTAFIDEPPLNMSEYTAAKAAGEMLCAFLEANHREMAVYRPRLPRMATDQTMSLLPVDKLDPVPMMIKALRCFRDSTGR